MRAVTQNGRTDSKGQVHGTKHNDRSFDLSKADHINSELTHLNHGWAYDNLSQTEAEKNFYEKHFGEWLAAKNEKYIKARHPEQVKTMDEIRTSPRYCPEESIRSIGKKEDKVPRETFEAVVVEFLKWRHDTFPQVRVIDFYFHYDEPNAVDHSQIRTAYLAHDKSGKVYPCQKKCLAEMGIERPDPKKPESKTNNAKVTFDRICREKFLDICQEHGLTMEREPQERSRSGLDKLTYQVRCEEEKMTAARQELQAAKAEAVEAQVALVQSRAEAQAAKEELMMAKADAAQARAEAVQAIYELEAAKDEAKGLRDTIEQLLKPFQKEIEEWQKSQKRGIFGFKKEEKLMVDAGFRDRVNTVFFKVKNFLESNVLSPREKEQLERTQRDLDRERHQLQMQKKQLESSFDSRVRDQAAALVAKYDPNLVSTQQYISELQQQLSKERKISSDRLARVKDLEQQYEPELHRGQTHHFRP